MRAATGKVTRDADQTLVKSLAAHDATVATAEKSEAEAAIVPPRAAMEGTDHDTLVRAIERMTRAVAEIAAAAAGAGPGAGGDGGAKRPGAPNEKGGDAEFEAVGHR